MFVKQIQFLFKFVIIMILGVAFGLCVTMAYQAIASQKVSLIFSTPLSSTATLASNVGDPAWLIIPRINVDAPIKPVGVDAKGNLGVPTDAMHVAWYKEGPRPGMPGAAVIDGHLDTKYAPQAVFYNLDELQPGDEVDIRSVDNQTIAFKVTNVKTYAYNASTSDIFISSDGVAKLNLITCTGDWVPEKKIYNERLVVFTERVLK